jgi:hypothetical protein
MDFLTRSRKLVALPVVAVIAAVTLSGVFTAPASAAPYTAVLTCDGTEVSYRQQPSGSNWGAVQVVAGGTGHLTPTAGYFELYDSTVGEVIWTSSSLKGDGYANHQQATTDCTNVVTWEEVVDGEVVEFGGTLADWLWLFEELTPGTSPTDEVTFTATFTVVWKG